MEILPVFGHETEDGGWVPGWPYLSLQTYALAVVRKKGIFWGGAELGRYYRLVYSLVKGIFYTFLYLVIGVPASICPCIPTFLKS